MVGMSARDYADGEYRGEVRLLSDDVARPTVSVPARMRIGRTPVSFELAPRVLGSLARSPRVTLEGVTGFTAAELDPLTTHLGGIAPVGRASTSGAGRTAIAFPAIEWVIAGLADGSRVLPFAAEAGERSWLVDTVLLAVSRPPLEVVGLPRYGAGAPTAHTLSGGTLALSFVPPALADRYEIALSPDLGVNWSLLASTPAPAWTFTPLLVGESSLIEVSAWQGDSLTAVWLSAPFVVEGRPSTGVGDAPLPERFALRVLGQLGGVAQPRLALDLPRAGEVRLDLFDVRGARVRSLLRGPLPAGTREIVWDGRQGSGARASAGVYFARAISGNQQAIRRIVLAR
jgi:hypothetical protein